MTMTPNTPQLIIFDCDGVLVDSEMIFNRILHAVISEYGALEKAVQPAPDVFLAAARANGTAPGQCVVIEDSATGIEAAHNAGMRCYAYVPKGHQPPANLFGATRFARMEDLPGLLGVS